MHQSIGQPRITNRGAKGKPGSGLEVQIESTTDTGKDNDDEGEAAAETAHSPARSPRARHALPPSPSPPVELGVSNPLPTWWGLEATVGERRDAVK